MAYRDQAEQMDAQVDARLGDIILYQPGGVGPWRALKGYIKQAEDDETATLPSPGMANRKRLKISKAQLATIAVTRPSGNDRIRSDATGDENQIYKPQTGNPAVANRYFLFGLDKC